MRNLLYIAALLISGTIFGQITIDNRSFSDVCVEIQDCGGYPVATVKIPANTEVSVNVSVASCGVVKYGTGYSCDTYTAYNDGFKSYVIN